MRTSVELPSALNAQAYQYVEPLLLHVKRLLVKHINCYVKTHLYFQIEASHTEGAVSKDKVAKLVTEILRPGRQLEPLPCAIWAQKGLA